MAALFGQLLGCCSGRRRPPKHDVLDETTPLIHPSLEAPPITVTQDDLIVDDPKTKERLGVIVKMKEGRMVNVTLRSPFHLRNEDSLRASSSRSRRSPSTNLNNRLHALIDSDAREGSLLSSPRLSPSGSRSPSSASLDPASSSFMSPGDQVVDREPVLQARLVNLRKRLETRRGRTLLRSAPLDVGDETADVDDEAGTAASAVDNDVQKVPNGGEVPQGMTTTEDTTMLSSASHAKGPEDESTPSVQPNFVLHSVGSIARDWGD